MAGYRVAYDLGPDRAIPDPVLLLACGIWYTVYHTPHASRSGIWYLVYRIPAGTELLLEGGASAFRYRLSRRLRRTGSRNTPYQEF